MSATKEKETAVPPVEIELKTVGETIDEIGQEIMANAVYMIEKIRNGQKVTKEEEAMQVEMNVQFKYLESTYQKLVKMKRIEGVSDKGVNSNESFDKNFLQKIKNKQTTMGAIVRDMSEGAKTAKG
jgi:hypothetical protein